jgi:SAM-dependent methyltransferase
MRVKHHATEFLDDEEARGIEDGIWWAVGRRAIIAKFLDKAAARGVRRIVEVGCGSGGDLPLLARYGKVSGVELSPILAQRARSRNVAEAVHTSDLFELPIADVDLFCMFDVLEHVEDDERFVRRLAEHAGRGHQLLLTVPACPWLYGPHDKLLHHYRRYSRRGLVALLERHGYQVEATNRFLFFLFPVAVAARFWDTLRQRLGFRKERVALGRVPAPVNALLVALLRLEALLGRRVRFPAGLWIAVLARR